MAQDLFSSRLGKLARPGLRWMPALVWLLVLAFAAWAGADLFWRFSRPAAVAALPTTESDPQKAARLLAGRNPFGSSAAPVMTARATAAPEFQLVGVATGFGKDPGFALLKAGDEPPMPVLEGESPAPGVVLRRILPDRVELEISGRRQELPLQEPKPSTALNDDATQRSANQTQVHPRYGRPGRLGRTISE